MPLQAAQQTLHPVHRQRRQQEGHAQTQRIRRQQRPGLAERPAAGSHGQHRAIYRADARRPPRREHHAHQRRAGISPVGMRLHLLAGVGVERRLQAAQSAPPEVARPRERPANQQPQQIQAHAGDHYDRRHQRPGEDRRQPKLGNERDHEAGAAVQRRPLAQHPGDKTRQQAHHMQPEQEDDQAAQPCQNRLHIHHRAAQGERSGRRQQPEDDKNGGEAEHEKQPVQERGKAVWPDRCHPPARARRHGHRHLAAHIPDIRRDQRQHAGRYKGHQSRDKCQPDGDIRHARRSRSAVSSFDSNSTR